MFAAGCRSRDDKGSNENRLKNHKYDFADYMNVYAVGVEGHGYIFIEPKVITRDMFENDDEFIKVKKDIEAIGLYYTPSSSNNSKNLAISKKEELSNGDSVAIGVSYSKQKLQSDMNLDTYAYTVSGLKEASEDVYVDLFSEDNVMIYGTADGKLNYSLNPESKVIDLLRKLSYKIDTDEKTLIENGTLINVSVSAGNKNTEEVGKDIPLFFAKNGYIVDEAEKEMILGHVTKPIYFDQLNGEDFAGMEQSLKNAIAETIEKGNIRLYSVQQNPDTSEIYKYIVTYSNVDGGSTVYSEATCLMYQIGDEFVVEEVKRTRGIKEEDVNASTENTILHVFN